MVHPPQANEESRFRELLLRHFSPIAALTTAQAARLYQHYELLVRWNRVLNLTTIRKLEEVVVRHYCEALFLAARLPGGALRVLDVGSGAGFPGVPCAVYRPDCQFVLAESHQRKAVFLKESTRDLGNVRVESRRAEDVEGPFDLVISRAVRWEDVLPVVEGAVALLLGEEDAAESCKGKGFEWEAPVSLPWGERRVLVFGRRVKD